MTRLALALALLTLAHCAPPEDNAVLLLRIKLPYAQGDRPFAEVQVSRDDLPFDDDSWETPEAIPFDLRESREIELAVQTRSPDAVAAGFLHVRIVLCEEPDAGDCQGDSSAPELQYTLEHPFYAGELTQWRAGPVDDTDAYHMPDSVVPATQAEIARQERHPVLIRQCSIAGCIQVASEPGASFRPPPNTGFCRRAGAQLVHFCAEDS